MAVEVFVQPVKVVWVEWNQVGWKSEPIGDPTWVVWGKGPHPIYVDRGHHKAVGDVLFDHVHKSKVPADGKVIRKAQ